MTSTDALPTALTAYVWPPSEPSMPFHVAMVIVQISAMYFVFGRHTENEHTVTLKALKHERITQGMALLIDAEKEKVDNDGAEVPATSTARQDEDGLSCSLWLDAGDWVDSLHVLPRPQLHFLHDAPLLP